MTEDMGERLWEREKLERLKTIKDKKRKKKIKDKEIRTLGALEKSMVQQFTKRNLGQYCYRRNMMSKFNQTFC